MGWEKDYSNGKEEGKMKRWVKLKVGGELLEATEETLTKFPDSKLAKMVTSYLRSQDEYLERNNYLDPENEEFIYLDINPVYFRAVLDWLR